MNKYFIIDITKLILAVFVVMIHTAPIFNNEITNSIFSSIYSIAVPLFFAFSGFFYKNNDSRPSKFLKRILILYGFWLIFSMHLVIGQNFHNERTLIQYLKQFVFSSSYSVSWYLISLAWCGIICTFTKRWNIALKFIIATLLYLMSVQQLAGRIFMGDIIGKFIEYHTSIFGTVAWSFPQGLLFFIIGYHLNRNFSKSLYSHKNISILISIIIYIGYIILSIALTEREVEYPKSIIILPIVITPILLSLILHSKPNKWGYLGKTIRNISTLLYLSHPIIKSIGYKFFDLRDRGIHDAIFVFAIFSIGCIVYYKIKDYKYFKWMNYAC